jgi:peroxiredoxin
MVGFALLGLAVLAAFIHERLPARPPASPPVAPAASSAVSPAAVPERRPDFTLSDLAGQRHPISAWDGKTLVVNFWATWCAPCRREIPLLRDLRREFSKNNVEVVGIAVDVAEDVRKFVRTTPIDYPLLTGEQDALDTAQAFGVSELALPFTVFIDAQGRILTIHLGELHAAPTRAVLELALKISAGTLDVTSGRAAIRALLDAAAPGPDSGATGASGPSH